MRQKVLHPRDESVGTIELPGGEDGLPEGFAWTPGQRVCIVTTEFHGLHKNGGIGTANTGLALALSEAGLFVTVLYANPTELSDSDLQGLQTYYHEHGINLEWVAANPSIPRPFEHSRVASYAVYLHLCEREFDVVYFHDNCGRGFYSLLARRTGCLAHSPLMLVVAHGPIEWVRELNSQRYQDVESVIMAYLERRSVELADAVISPSRYMLDWMRTHDWVLPEHVFVEQNIVRMPTDKDGSSLERPPIDVPNDEIVFFGRLEVRKGLALFCDAIDDLQRLDRRFHDLRITFLGKFAHVDGLHSGIYLTERSLGWPNRLRVLANLDQSEALRYLSRPGVLAIIPSLAENSPCVVVECVRLGIPFIATDSGGTAELIDPEDWGRCLTSPEPEKLADRICSTVKDGHAPAALAMSPAQVVARWAAFHNIRPEADRFTVPRTHADHEVGSRSGHPAAPPLVSVCLFNSDGVQKASELLGSLLQQTYSPLEIILAELDNSAAEDFPAAPPGDNNHPVSVRRVTVDDPRDSASALRAAAACATGDYLLFLDERRVTLLDDGIEALVRAARRTDADVVTGFPAKREATGTAAWTADDRIGALQDYPVGACLDAGVLENCFGGALALVSRQMLSLLNRVPTGDDGLSSYWQFFAACAVAGCRFEVVPRPLFQYRSHIALGLRKAQLLESYRELIDIYGHTRIQYIKNILENFVDVDAEHRDRLRRALSDLKDDRRESIFRISTLDANSREAIDEFVRHLLERGRVEEALEFALSNNEEAGSAVRLASRETVIEFTRPTSDGWQLELQVGGAISIDQLRSVSAFLGDHPLAVEVVMQGAGSGGALLRITGNGSDGVSPEIRVRVLLPYVHRVGDASLGTGYIIQKMAIKAFELPAGAAVDGPSGEVLPDGEHLTGSEFRNHEAIAPFSGNSKITSIPVPARPNLANTGTGILLTVVTPAADDLSVRFGSIQLDESYLGANYRHLDLSAADVSIEEQVWEHVKFKFCLSANERLLEFREMPGWPTIFSTFPGSTRDAYGLVSRLGEKNVADASSWPSQRDQLLVQAIATLLPAMVETAAQSVPDYDQWIAQARTYSTSFLATMREHQLGTFKSTDADATGKKTSPQKRKSRAPTRRARRS